MKKKLTSVLLALCLLAPTLPVGVVALADEGGAAGVQIAGSAEAAEAETAAADEGEVILAADGELVEELGLYFNASAGTITGFDPETFKAGECEIPDQINGAKVTGIGNGAFKGCTDLKTVVIPGTVAKIGEYAFEGCDNLETVTLTPNTRDHEFTVEIGQYAFKDCKALTTLNLPEKVTKLGRNCFEGSGLTSLTIPASVTEAGLGGATNLTSVTLAEGRTKIENNFFEGSSVSKVEIPTTVTEIGYRAFRNCDNLEAFDIPKQIATIDSEAFEGCDNLAKITLNNNDGKEFSCRIGNSAFANTKLTELEIPKSVIKLGSNFISGTSITSITIRKNIKESDGNVLAGCDTLTEVKLEDGMTWLPNGLCESIPHLKSITIPESVTEIGNYAFKNCAELESINIPEAVKTIGYNAFEGCTVLRNVTLNCNDQNEFNGQIGRETFKNCVNLETLDIPKSFTSLGGNFIEGTAITSLLIHNTVKSGSGALKGCASLANVTLEDGMTKIPEGLFNSTGITGVTIPESVTEIPNYTFENCTKLKEINIPKAVTSIGYRAFKGCSLLEKVTFNEDKNWRECEYKIDGEAFMNCPNLTELNIPRTFTNLGSDIINGTSIENITIHNNVKQTSGGVLRGSNLKKVEFANGSKSVSKGICQGATNLTEVIIPETVTEIGDYAFSGCTSLTELNIPGRVERLGRHLIEGTKIQSITIPKSVKKPSGGQVLYGCPSLTKVILEEGITCVPNGLCDYENTNSYIENVIIPDSVTEIGEHAFYNCDMFTEVNIPNGVTDIGQQAFMNCDKLAKVTFNYNEDPAFTLKIGDRVFKGCKSLKSLDLPEKVTSLGDELISGTPIGSITIPSTVESAYGALRNDIWLDNVYFAEGMTKIPGGICYDWDWNNNSKKCYISYVEIPSTVTEIGNDAFRNCTRLPKLTLPEGVTEIGNDAFTNCSILTISCPEGMPAITKLVDDRVNFSIIKDKKSYENLVASGTRYITDYSDVSTVGMVNLEVQYRFNEAVLDRISETKVEIKLPVGAEVVNSTVKVNGVMSTDFEIDSSNLLKIPVTEAEGTIALCIVPTEQTRIQSYARMTYRLDNERSGRGEVIGVINQDIPLLTIKADSVTSAQTITVSGIALPGETIDFYCDDKYLTNAEAKTSGKYSAEITLPTTENYKTYTIEAWSKDSEGNDISAQTKVTYQEDAPQLTGFAMHYNKVSYDLYHMDKIKPTITFVPGVPFVFEVAFDNGDSIDQVYVVSNRNNNVKRIEAEYDPDTGTYIAAGYFDDSNHSYVPGVISVEYLQDSEPYVFSKEIDFSSAKYANTLPEAWEESSITPAPEAEVTPSAAADSLSGVAELVNTLQGELNFGVLTRDIPQGLNEGNAEAAGYVKVTDIEGVVMYVKLEEVSDSRIYVEVVSFDRNKMYSFLLENETFTAEEVSAPNILNSIISTLGDITQIITYDGNRVDLETLRQEVMNLPLPTEEIQARLALLERVKLSNTAALAVLALSTAMAIGDNVDPPAPSSPIFVALVYMNTYYVELALADPFSLDWRAFAMRVSAASNLTCRWAIDPSGYVYEAVTTNRLEGVTATAYWKEDESAAEGILWDAAEYEQANPLVTDVNGIYAWDVPEGLWQVKYEKEGYETQTTEWLPVPPPQTNVNIGLVSRAVPTVESAVMTPERLTITFDKYMKPETLADNITIEGSKFTLTYPTNETAPDGTVYARTFICTLAEALPAGTNVAVTVSGAESYADVPMEDYSETLSAGEAPPSAYDVTIQNAAAGKDDNTVTAEFVNNTAQVLTFTAFCAAYDENGALVEIKRLTVLANGEATVTKTFSLDSDWTSCKIFAWSDITSMKPIAEPAEI